MIVSYIAHCTFKEYDPIFGIKNYPDSHHSHGDMKFATQIIVVFQLLTFILMPMIWKSDVTTETLRTKENGEKKTKISV